ncbi:Sucrose/H+ symporter, plant [Penicillium camemberti]|uniref:Sucrose/H+ symporter, plant n=1 Tax=Penicillium camemberti (strain FM 013) TaxID=1429867 RepID=A0A0G4PKQ8_PENC3|nr:Sucrose/H+ symporter, plant [Penicillium camemberti]
MTTQEQAALVASSQDEEHTNHKSSGLQVGKLAVGSLLLDESFVLTTGSDVASDLNASSSAAWLITGYNLGYILALPVYGQICDSTGPKRAILLALTVYGSGCLMTGVSQSIHLAVAGRIISGFGGAGMNELVSVILNEVHSFDRVAMLRSYVTTVSIIGITCGAPLGAFLTSWIGWQWAFLIHIPFAMICLIIISLSLSPKKPSTSVTPKLSYGSIDDRKAPESTPRKSFDILGLILLFISVTCFLAFVQLTQAENLENKSIFLTVCTAAFVGCFTAFCLNETRWAQDPMIHFSLLSPKKFGLIYSAQVLLGIAQFSMAPILGDYWVSSRGLSPSEGAMCWIPGTIGFASGSLVTGKLIQNFTLILVRWTIFEPHFWEILYSFPGWFGMGMLLSSQFAALSAAKPEQNAATSITTYYFAQQVGLMTGITAAKALLIKEMRRGLNVALKDQAGRAKLIDQIMGHRQLVGLVPPALAEPVRLVIQKSYCVSPAISLVSLLIAFFIVLKQRDVKTF